MNELYTIKRDEQTSDVVAERIDVAMDKAVKRFCVEELLELTHFHYIRHRNKRMSTVYSLVPMDIEGSPNKRYGTIRLSEDGEIALNIYDGRPDPDDASVVFAVVDGARAFYYLSYSLNADGAPTRIDHSFSHDNQGLTESDMNFHMIRALKSVLMAQLGSDFANIRATDIKGDAA